MGKPLAESHREIDESVDLLDYYTSNSEQFVDDENLNLSTG